MKRFARRYQTCFKYIFVDEYQDLNQGQVKLLNILAPPEANVGAVI